MLRKSITLDLISPMVWLKLRLSTWLSKIQGKCLLFVTVDYRPLITMRMVKPRKEFSLENYQMIEKDAAENTIDLKH